VDSDCSGGANGRCGHGAVNLCMCSYDTCMADSDCTTGQTCACHGSTYNIFGNTCVPSNCRVDSDCGARGYCSPSTTPGQICGAVGGYYCHTPDDQCVENTDCVGDAGTEACVFSTASRHWECQLVLECV